MRCPACDADLELGTLLATAQCCWTVKHWVWFVCPRCRSGNHLSLGPRQAATGTIDGAPGPNFMEHDSGPVAGLTVRWSETGLEAELGGRRFRAPNKSHLPKCRAGDTGRPWVDADGRLEIYQSWRSREEGDYHARIRIDGRVRFDGRLADVFADDAEAHSLLRRAYPFTNPTVPHEFAVTYGRQLLTRLLEESG